MKYSHTNINSPDWERLSEFYQNVFDCKPVPPLRHIYGEWFERASGIKDAEVRGIHLALPGFEEGGPTIEILTHTNRLGETGNKFNATGFGHIAIHVDDVDLIVEHDEESVECVHCGTVSKKTFENPKSRQHFGFPEGPWHSLPEVDGRSPEFTSRRQLREFLKRQTKDEFSERQSVYDDGYAGY